MIRVQCPACGRKDKALAASVTIYCPCGLSKPKRERIRMEPVEKVGT